MRTFISAILVANGCFEFYDHLDDAAASRCNSEEKKLEAQDIEEIKMYSKT